MQPITPVPSPQETPVDHPQSPEDMRFKAESLWQLLDDIDTALDAFKPEMRPFVKYVSEKVEERFQHFESDGHRLFATRRAGSIGGVQ